MEARTHACTQEAQPDTHPPPPPARPGRHAAATPPVPTSSETLEDLSHPPAPHPLHPALLRAVPWAAPYGVQFLTRDCWLWASPLGDAGRRQTAREPHLHGRALRGGLPTAPYPADTGPAHSFLGCRSPQRGHLPGCSLKSSALEAAPSQKFRVCMCFSRNPN